MVADIKASQQSRELSGLDQRFGNVYDMCSNILRVKEVVVGAALGLVLENISSFEKLVCCDVDLTSHVEVVALSLTAPSSLEK